MSLNKPNYDKPESKPTTPKPTVAETQAKRMSMKQKVGLTLGTLALGLGTTLPSFGTEKAPAQSNLDTQPTAEQVITTQDETITQAPTAPIQIAQAETHKHTYHFKNDAERDAMFKKVLKEHVIKIDSQVNRDVANMDPNLRITVKKGLDKMKNMGRTTNHLILSNYDGIAKSLKEGGSLETMKLQMKALFDTADNEISSKDKIVNMSGKWRKAYLETVVELIKINFNIDISTN
jgi:hypothetical protein